MGEWQLVSTTNTDDKGVTKPGSFPYVAGLTVALAAVVLKLASTSFFTRGEAVAGGAYLLPRLIGFGVQRERLEALAELALTYKGERRWRIEQAQLIDPEIGRAHV